VLIEQAIFTSVQTSTSAGYQLVATSPGIGDVDARELATWGPSHDSLWEAGAAAESVNFFGLPSGAFCISRTIPVGAEYSQRRGPQIYTQSLVVAAKDFQAFGNNPLLVLQLAVALGHVTVHEKMPKRLEPFELEPNGDGVDRQWLAQLVRHPGPVWIGALLHTALTTSAIGIVAGERGPLLIAALINCLPVECRTEFSFSTGLRFSPRRPFRAICLPNNFAENQRLQRQQFLTLLEVKSSPPACHVDGWAGFVSSMVNTGNTDYLADVLNQPRPGLTIDRLDELGAQLAQGLAPWRADRAVAERAASRDASLKLSSREDASRAASCDDPAPSHVATSSDAWQRADGSHGCRPVAASPVIAENSTTETTLAATLEVDEEPARYLAESCPAAQQQLQLLEDAIFEAMAGKEAALAELQALWPHVIAQVGPSLLEAVRERYLRYALSLWRQVSHAEGTRDPARACHAMEIICLLFE
jgi:hypothetical protein